MAILGDGGVGKSSLLRAKTENHFSEESKITIGVDVACIPFEYKQVDDMDSTFLAVDLGGQQRFHFIHDAYLKGVKSAIIVYDLTRYRTFLNLSHWSQLVFDENPMIPVFIVGTKMDLVSQEERLKFEDEYNQMKATLPNHSNIIGQFFVSSKNQDGIAELFKKAEEMMKYYYPVDRD